MRGLFRQKNSEGHVAGTRNRRMLIDALRPPKTAGFRDRFHALSLSFVQGLAQVQKVVTHAMISDTVTTLAAVEIRIAADTRVGATP